MHLRLSLIVTLLPQLLLSVGKQFIKKNSFWEYSRKLEQHFQIFDIALDALLYSGILDLHCELLNKISITSPCNDVARWTWPIEAAAKGFNSNDLNFYSH